MAQKNEIIIPSHPGDFPGRRKASCMPIGVIETNEEVGKEVEEECPLCLTKIWCVVTAPIARDQS